MYGVSLVWQGKCSQLYMQIKIAPRRKLCQRQNWECFCFITFGSFLCSRLGYLIPRKTYFRKKNSTIGAYKILDTCRILNQANLIGLMNKALLLKISFLDQQQQHQHCKSLVDQTGPASCARPRSIVITVAQTQRLTACAPLTMVQSELG